MQSDSQSTSLQAVSPIVGTARQTVTLADIGMLSHYSALPNMEGAGLMTTLDLADRANILAIQSALAGDSDSLWDAEPDQLILVSDLVAHFKERKDEETGAPVSGPMLTLIGPDGVWHTGSQYAFRCLQDIAYLTGRPPWKPPIAIRAVRKRSRNKREYQSLILAE